MNHIPLTAESLHRCGATLRAVFGLLSERRASYAVPVPLLAGLADEPGEVAHMSAQRWKLNPARRRRALAITAYHEAGHAAVALILGRQLERLAVRANASGFVNLWPDEAAQNQRDWIERELMVSLGGDAAEAIYCGTAIGAGTEMDQKYARQVADQVRAWGEDVDQLLERMQQRTVNLLRDPYHWCGVTQIAAALLERRNISGQTAKTLFEAAQRRQT